MVYVYKKDDEYYLVEDDGFETKCEVKQPKGWDATLFLPENSANRKLINLNRLEKALEKADKYELSVKSPVTISNRGPRMPKKADEEYLNDEDKKLYLELKAKIAEAKEAEKAAAKKELSPKEKLMAKIAKWTAQLQAMEDEDNG